jgi:diguanylate cyclase (GGDEF)-like protein
LIGKDADSVWVRRVLSGATSVVFAVLAAGGFFIGTLGWGQLIAVAVLLGSVVTLAPVVHGRASRSPYHRIGYAALLLVAVQVFSDVLGPPLAGQVLILHYAIVAVVCLTQTRKVAALTTATAMLLSLVLWDTMAVSLFQFVVTATVAAVALRVRYHSGDFQSARLAAEVPSERATPDSDLTLDSAMRVEDSIRASLRLLHTGLDCHNAALLWYDHDGNRLVLRDAVGNPELLSHTAHPGEGALAGVLRRREPVHLQSLRSSYRGLTYYRDLGPGPVRNFLGVPVMENDGDDARVLGILCLDRTSAVPFDASAEQLALDAAGSIVRAMTADRLLHGLDKSRRELDHFYEASRELNSALKPDDVYDVALGCAREIVDFDVAAVVLTSLEDGHRVHRVERLVVSEPLARTRWAPLLENLSFDHNAGLVSMAIEMRHPLPWGGIFDPDRNMAFTRTVSMKEVRSLLVLPLVAQEHEVGALVIGATRSGGFAKESRELLEVIANQVAVSLANARMYKEMEEMATIDGLTGLNNRRTFSRSLVEVVARSERVDGPFCLLLTDIDHFKSINDTYGHPMGDEVLRCVSRTFLTQLRQTDIPARYGGEEFAIILEGTELEGAKQIAEKLRHFIEEMKFDTPQGRFSIGMSFGVAEFPTDSTDPNTLIERADQALYYAKAHGRNQVRVWRTIQRDLDSPPNEPVRTVA